MAIRVTSSLDDRFDETIDEIERMSLASKELTPRSRARLERAARQGNLVVAFSADTLAGWGIREPVSRNTSELGMTFVKPEYRDTDAFELLARELTNTKRKLVMATYRKDLQQYTIDHLGFKPSDLFEVIKVSRGGFLLKRMNPASRRSIQHRMRDSKPLFAIRDAR